MKVSPFYLISKPADQCVLQFLGPGYLWDGDTLIIELSLLFVSIGVLLRWRQQEVISQEMVNDR